MTLRILCEETTEKSCVMRISWRNLIPRRMLKTFYWKYIFWNLIWYIVPNIDSTTMHSRLVRKDWNSCLYWNTYFFQSAKTNNCNFWTNDAILKSFTFSNFLNLGNIFNFMTLCLIGLIVWTLCLNVWAAQLFQSTETALPLFTWFRHSAWSWKITLRAGNTFKQYFCLPRIFNSDYLS